MKKKIYAYLHTHWDREWYRDKEDFNLRLLEVLDIVLDELEHNRAPFFYLDGQVIALLDYLKYREEKKDLIIKLIKQNKLAIGPFYVSADSYLVSFPFMLKNIDYGMAVSKEFNQKEFIGYMSDIFGVSNSIFEALKRKNIDKALIWRGVNPEKIKNNCNFIKNTINTTWLAQGYFNDFLNLSCDTDKKVEYLKGYIEKIAKYSPDSILLPIGADHLGMLKNAKKEIAKVNKKLKDYEIILTSPFEYFKNTKHKNKTKETEFIDNSNTYTLPGVYSSRIYQKVRNVFLENKISRIIEPLNYFLELNYQKNIDYMSKTLIKNHAHDGICGCSIDSVHKVIDARLNCVENIANALLKRIVGDFKKKNDIVGKTDDKIGIFNLSNTNLSTIKIVAPYKIKNAQILSYEERFDDELLYDSYKIPVTEDITKIYTQLVEINPAKSGMFEVKNILKPKKEVFVKENTLENNNIKFQIKNNKFYIFNKNSKEKVKFKITDIKDNGDSYNFSPKGEYKILDLIKSKIIEDGNIRAGLRLFFKDITIDLYLDNDSKYLSFESKINNKSKNHKIQIVFETSDNISKTISQDAYGTVKRDIDFKYKIQDYMPAKRPVELKTNLYPMQNFVCANDFSVMTCGLHEYEIYKNELRVCLLRSFSTISNPKNETRAIPAGPDLTTSDSQCLGENRQKFAVLFGNYEKCFCELDKFFENYVTITGRYENAIKYKLFDLAKNEYMYCINEKKIISHKFK